MLGSFVRRVVRQRTVLLVFVLALIARLMVVIRSGGFLGDFGYDPGVYYAGADALLHGLVPYREFVFLHPPGILLITAPFAALGRLANDHVGYVAATFGFQVIGALDAALVVVVARRLGAGGRAAAIGGVFYALWPATTSAEYLVRLEPLGNLCLLAGLAVTAGVGTRRNALIAGASLGLACSVKIWFAVPLVLLLVYQGRQRGLRSAATTAAGALLAIVAVDGPFAVLAGRSMWSRVVTDQLGRGRTAGAVRYRLEYLTGLARLWGARPVRLHEAAVAAVVLGFLLLVRRAWRTSAFRPLVALAGANLAVLFLAPSFFGFYADFAAVPVALVVAGAAITRPVTGRFAWRRRAYAWAPAMVCALLTAVELGAGTFRPVVQWQDQRQLAAAVDSVRCVSSDAPEGLIELDVLDRDFDHGCRDWVDVTGRTYFGVDHSSLGRSGDPQWQHDLETYLASGNRIFLVRARGTGLTPATMRALSPKLIHLDNDGDSVVVAGRAIRR